MTGLSDLVVAYFETVQVFILETFRDLQASITTQTLNQCQSLTFIRMFEQTVLVPCLTAHANVFFVFCFYLQTE